MRALGILIIALAIAGCSKDDKKPPEKADPVGTIGADGLRRIPVDVAVGVYHPDKIVAQPGEKLVLVFTRRAGTGHCQSQVHIADGPLIELAIGKPTEVEVTAPEAGATIRFACGMDMQTGVIAVN